MLAVGAKNSVKYIWRLYESTVEKKSIQTFHDWNFVLRTYKLMLAWRNKYRKNMQYSAIHKNSAVPCEFLCCV